METTSAQGPLTITVQLDPDDPDMAITVEAPEGCATIRWVKEELCRQDPTGAATPESFLLCSVQHPDAVLDDGLSISPDSAVLLLRSPAGEGGAGAEAAGCAEEAQQVAGEPLAAEPDDEVEDVPWPGLESEEQDPPWDPEVDEVQTPLYVDGVFETGLPSTEPPEVAGDHAAREAEVAEREAEAVRVAERRERQAAERRAKEEASRRRIAVAGDAWHTILGVSSSAPVDVVKRAYHELALLHHPDKGLSGSENEEAFKRVQRAYEQGLRVAPPEAPPSSRGEASLARRRGEFDVGDQVVVDGLDKRADLNGQWAACQSGVDSSSGRVEVIVSSGETVRVKPENLTRTELYKGTPIRVVGLCSRPELNGLVGCLGDYDVAKERWNVNMQDKSVLRLLSKCCVRTKLNAKPIVMKGAENSAKWGPDMFGIKRGRCNKCGIKCPVYRGLNIRTNGCGMPRGSENALNCVRCGCSNQDHAKLGKIES